MSNLIIPQTFNINIYEENQYKLFGVFFDFPNMREATWYTSTYTGFDPDGNTPYGAYLPDFNDEIYFGFVWRNNTLNNNLGTGRCATVDNSPGVPVDFLAPECQIPGANDNIYDNVSSDENDRGCCVTSITFKTCDDGDYGNNPNVQIRKCQDGVCGECGVAGTLAVSGDEYGGNFTYATLILNYDQFGSGWGSLNVPTSAQYITTPDSIIALNELSDYWDVEPSDLSNGVYTRAAIPKVDTITLNENGTYRRGFSYCDHRPSSHAEGTFQCPGDNYETGDWVNMYGTYEITDVGGINLYEHPPNAQYETSGGTSYLTLGNPNSVNPNEFGNPCVELSGTGLKYNGRSLTWDTQGSCVSVGDSPEDTGFDLSLPQGSGQNPGGNSPTPYEGFIPERGLKILKSFPHPDYNDMLWWDRDISIYYLSTDGRYMTEGGTKGTFELNRKNETLKLYGLTQSAKCFTSSPNVLPAPSQTSSETEEECVQAGNRWYYGGNTIISIDSTGFQDAIIQGNIINAYSTYSDSNGEFISDTYGIGEIKSLPITFNSTVVWDAVYDGTNPSKIYLNADSQNDFMAMIRHRVVNGEEVSGADFGYDNVRIFTGELGLNSSDNWSTWTNNGGMQGQTPPDGFGLAFGWASHKTFYGYGYHESYANGNWDPSDILENKWKHEGPIGHRLGAFITVNFEDPNNPSYDNILSGQNLPFQYFHPSAPCDNDGVDCGGFGYGYINEDVVGDVSAISEYSLGTEICDINQTAVCSAVNGDFNYPQCDFEGEIIRPCIGCMDPGASNYCVPFGCTYQDFSCFYELDDDVTPGLTCDANGDGGVNVLDVVAIVNFALGNLSESNVIIENMDYNGDGGVNVLDVVGCANLILSNTTLSDGVSSQDRRLLKNIVSTVQKPNGLRNARKLFTRSGYNTKKLRDYLLKGKKTRRNSSRIFKHQFRDVKSKKVENNLTGANDIIRRIRE